MSREPPVSEDRETDCRAIVRANTTIATPPLVPEIRLHLATEITPIWGATEVDMARTGLPPPFWAFAWAGGQALARFVLDRPEWVSGRTVLDFAAGSGIGAIAAALAGAKVVTATEIDPYARSAIALNGALNAATVEIEAGDAIGSAPGRAEVILAGDVCYERPLAEAAGAWFRALAGAGATVLLGDPGRAYLPSEGLHRLATYQVLTTRELEDRDLRETNVWRVMP